MTIITSLGNKAIGTSVTKMLNKTKVQWINEANAIKKIVTKNNGDTFVSKFTKDGKNLISMQEKTKRGSINYLFGAQNYDKVVEVRDGFTGKYFTFLGHRNRPQGLLYSNMSGRYDAGNNYMPQYKEAIDYIRGKSTKFIASALKF